MGVVVLYESQTEGSRLTQQRRFGEAELGRVLAVRKKWKPIRSTSFFILIILIIRTVMN